MMFLMVFLDYCMLHEFHDGRIVGILSEIIE